MFKRKKCVAAGIIILVILFLNISLDFSNFHNNAYQNIKLTRLGSEVYAETVSGSFSFDTGKYYYPYDKDPKVGCGLSGTVSYTIDLENKELKINSYTFKKIGSTTERKLYVEFYKYQDGTSKLSSRTIATEENPGSGSNIIIDFSSIQDTIGCIRFRCDGLYVKVGSSYTEYYTLYYDGTGKTLNNLILKQEILNTKPSISIISPSSNAVFRESDIAFTPKISVSDVDNNALTCKFYVDSETSPRDTKIIEDTETAKVVSFNAINMSSLGEGNHSIKYEISDGKADPVISKINFKVDKNPPVLGTISASSTTNSITVSGSATDSVSGLNSYPYRFTIGSSQTSWLSNSSYTINNLQPNTSYQTKFEARDNKNHVASKTQSIYTKADVPKLAVSNASSYTLDITTTDKNPVSTRYLISINGGKKYVTPEGNLTSSPVWIELSNKKITVKGLAPSTNYTFTAKARNASNTETANSSSVSGTTLVKPPDAPVNLIATSTSIQTTVSWDVVTSATEYEIQADNDVISTGTDTIYTHTSLAPGTPHTYRVRAKNAGGFGDWSAQITKSTLPLSPDIPGNLSALPQSTSITITWSNVPGATGYDIEVDGALVNNGPNTNYTHSSLAPGTHHTYRVRSVNPGGKSGWSSPVNATTTQESSPVPVNLRATPSQNSVSLTWDAVDGATGYDIEVDGVIINNNTSTSYIHKSLSQGSQHIYRVRSKRNGVISDWSGAVVVETVADIFGVPTAIRTEVKDTSISLMWDPVKGATGYDVELSRGTADVDNTIINNGEEVSILLAGLQPGTSYTLRVRARGESQTSEWSDPVHVSTFDLPTPIIQNAVSDESSISLSWEITTGAAVVFDLDVDGTIIPDIEEYSYSCSGLLPSTQHIFKVRARNDEGASNWSIPIIKSTIYSASNAPLGLAAMIKSTSVVVMWQAMNGAM